MNKINLSKDSVLIDADAFNREAKRLGPYFAHLREVVFNNNYDEKEASLNLSNDDTMVEEVLDIKNVLFSPRLKYIFVIGIGGSNLGAIAVYNAFGIKKDDLTHQPGIIFLDTNNSKLIASTIELIKKDIFFPEEFVINVISKSGTTTETLANFEVIYKVFLVQLKGDEEELSKRIVVTTDENSKLWEVADDHNFKKIAIPKNVGGRYSVFSPVGLLPLALVNVDIKEFQLGAKEMLNECIVKEDESNFGLVSAVSLYLHSTNGKNIVNTFVFNKELEDFGKWYSQLMGESIGKEFDRDGKNVNVGITPLVSIGSTDLHSIAQLFLGGPKDKFTFFIHCLSNTGIVVPKDLISQNTNSVIADKDLHEIMRAILGGTEETYKKQSLPFIDISLTDISPYSLGALMQLKMLEIMFLAELFNVNAFDQPNVEAYKKETKRILESQ